MQNFRMIGFPDMAHLPKGGVCTICSENLVEGIPVYSSKNKNGERQRVY